MLRRAIAGLVRVGLVSGVRRGAGGWAAGRGAAAVRSIMSSTDDFGPVIVRKAHQRPQDAMDLVGLQNRRVRGPTGEFLTPGEHPVSKRPVDSMCTLLLPFKSDPQLRDAFVNHWGFVRIGKLLEEIDAFAGNIAYAHADDNDAATEPLTIVTASVDRIEMLRQLFADVDVQLRGCCTYVGRSSMNVEVELTTVPSPGRPAELVATVAMTFVARDKANRATAVIPVEPGTDAERELVAQGRAAQEARKAMRQSSLYLLPPTGSEFDLVHSLFRDLLRVKLSDGSGILEGAPSTKMRPAGVRYMDDTALETVHITMPQDRNIHKKIFGGWILRQAFELAWACAYTFTGQHPSFLAMSDVNFLVPVEVGTLLHFSARVEYSLGPPHKTVSVCVSADMRNPSSGNRKLSNDFHFTFSCNDPVHKVYPFSYADAMAWLHAHRRRRHALELVAQREAAGGPRIRFS